AEARGSRLEGGLIVRRTGERTSVVVPDASLRGRNGATLVALSRLQASFGGGEAARFAGSFATGGPGLPRIAGRLRQRPAGGLEARLSMTEYSAGDSRLSIPELAVIQRADGALGFSGQLRASGTLPGGRAEGLDR